MNCAVAERDVGFDLESIFDGYSIGVVSDSHARVDRARGMERSESLSAFFLHRVEDERIDGAIFNTDIDLAAGVGKAFDEATLNLNGWRVGPGFKRDRERSLLVERHATVDRRVDMEFNAEKLMF